MKRPILLAVLIIVAALLVLGGVKALQIRALIASAKSFVPPPETVSSAVAKEEKWADTLSAVGSITAFEGVTLSPEIPGKVVEIHFDSGQPVSVGDLLLKLDTSSEDAQLRAVEAQVDLARLNNDRARQLRANNTVSQSELDSSEAALKQQQSNADAIRAEIAKKNIRAPFSGQLGIRLVNLGELLDAGKPIVSLQSLSPVFADFSLPQQELARLKEGLQVRVTTDTYPDRQFDGKLTAINPDLDAVTRSVRVRAEFQNDDKLLRPGMFVRVEVVLPESQTVLAIPATSVLTAPYGDSIYLITTNTSGTAGQLVVEQKLIRTGRARGDFISVESGLKAGDRLVRDGVFKLHNGSSIQVNDTNTAQPSLSPNPPNS